jgi:hypothetical protein
VGLPIWVYVVTICIYLNVVPSNFSKGLDMSVGRQIWRGSAGFGGPANPFFFFGISFSGPHWAFSHCHVEANHCAMSTNCTITCHVSVQSATSAATSSYHVSRHVTVRSSMWLYRLPRGTFLLVHEMTRKCQKWVTRGSLWCCHVTMMTSC